MKNGTHYSEMTHSEFLEFILIKVQFTFDKMMEQNLILDPKVAWDLAKKITFAYWAAFVKYDLEIAAEDLSLQLKNN
jgi:hypothetical protein